MPRINNKLKNIDDFIADYLEFCSYKNLSVKTIKFYQQTLMLFCQYFKEEKEIIDIRKVNKDTVEDCFGFIKNRGKYSFTRADEKVI